MKLAAIIVLAAILLAGCTRNLQDDGEALVQAHMIGKCEMVLTSWNDTTKTLRAKIISPECNQSE